VVSADAVARHVHAVTGPNDLAAQTPTQTRYSKRTPTITNARTRVSTLQRSCVSRHGDNSVGTEGTYTNGSQSPEVTDVNVPFTKRLLRHRETCTPDA
jgi:hypothetical protein